MFTLCSALRSCLHFSPSIGANLLGSEEHHHFLFPSVQASDAGLSVWKCLNFIWLLSFYLHEIRCAALWMFTLHLFVGSKTQNPLVPWDSRLPGPAGVLTSGPGVPACGQTSYARVSLYVLCVLPSFARNSNEIYPCFCFYQEFVPSYCWLACCCETLPGLLIWSVSHWWTLRGVQFWALPSKDALNCPTRFFPWVYRYVTVEHMPR